MQDYMEALLDPSSLLIHPGTECFKSDTGTHKAQWIPGETSGDHSNLVGSSARYFCLACGLDMQVTIICFTPDIKGHRYVSEWMHPSEADNGR